MFRKVLMLNFKKADLAREYWKRIDKIAKEKVLIQADEPKVERHLESADCLLLKLGMGADKKLIDSAPSLGYIGMFGTGFGRIDTEYAAKKGTSVCNIAGYSTQAVAELVFACLLEHLREIARAKAQAAKGDYSEATFTGTEIGGKAFGVIGLGGIGARVAEIASRGFGANVIYWSRNRKRKYERQEIRYQPINSLLKNAQIISLHLAYNKSTEKFLNAKRLRLVRPGAVVINTAPMELVDIRALETRLKKKDITFILDHSDEIDRKDAKKLAKYKNCIMYPPIGYTTKEATAAKQDIFVSNLENYLRGKPTNKVN